MEELPKEATHFFTNVDFSIIPEIDYQKLEEISQISKANNTADKYLDLRESLIKLMWTNLSGLRAIWSENELMKQYEPQVLVQDCLLQIEHEKNIFDFITHTKSSLDAIATFLNQYFQIHENGGNIDFKRMKFRNRLINKEASFKNLFDKLYIWFQENRGKSDSIVSIRDFWIHQSTPWIQMLWPPTEIGVLPIPKYLTKSGLAETEFWKTQDFVKYHYDLLVTIFMCVMDVCLRLERIQCPDLEIQRTKDKLCFFPLTITQTTTFKEIRLGKITIDSINSTRK